MTTSLQRVSSSNTLLEESTQEHSLYIQVNERVAHKHVACITELDNVCMNLNTRVAANTFVLAARVQHEGEGVLVGVEETASHGRVERKRERGW